MREGMTPAELRAICDSLNDERGTGGQSKLARLLGWDSSTIRRKLAGRSKITQSNQLAIERVIQVPTAPSKES
jgi:DNA-binding transcriptional regulator YdaS (Cro superfamily)